jgi:hypothetical protein
MIPFTRWFIIAVFVLVIAYDVMAYCTAGPEATISEVLRRWKRDWPLLGYLLAFGFGILFAHLLLDD